MPTSEALGELKWLWFSTPQPLMDIEYYDSAGRGPRGSLQALFRWSWLRLSSLGAMITLLAILIDPLSQNAVQNYDCQVSMGPNTAQLTRSNNYTQWWAPDGQSVTLDAQQSSLQAATYIGMLDPPNNASQRVAFECPTGNYVFDGFSTLAVCHKVEDISFMINCNSSASMTTFNATDISGNTTEITTANTTWCSLPSGVVVGHHLDNDFYLKTGVPHAFWANRTQWGFGEVEMLSLNANTDCNSASWPPGPDCSPLPVAYRAEIYPCVRTYTSARIVNFQLIEQLYAEIPMPVIYSFDTEDETQNKAYYSLVSNATMQPNVDCKPSPVRNSPKTQIVRSLHNGLLFADHVNVDAVLPGSAMLDFRNNHSAVMWYDPRCTYSYDSLGSYLVWDNLVTAFGWTLNGLELDSQSKGLHVNSAQERDAYGRYAQAWGDPWLLKLFRGGTMSLDSVTKFMDGLTNAMTATVRRTGDITDSGPAPGEQYVTKICVRVVWPWLAVDVVLLIFCLPFLMVTIWRSWRKTSDEPGERSSRGPWKSSSLPLLWSGLSDEVRSQAGILDHIEDMEERSAVLEVVLCQPNRNPATTQSDHYSTSGDTAHKSVCAGTGLGPGPWTLAAKKYRPELREHPIRRWGQKVSHHVPI